MAESRRRNLNNHLLPTKDQGTGLLFEVGYRDITNGDLKEGLF